MSAGFGSNGGAPAEGTTSRGGGRTQPQVGLLEWFHQRDYEHVERTLDDLRALEVRHLRTGISWADYHTPEGRDWYLWLLPRLASQVEVLPCFLYTPPSLGIVPRSSSPPREPRLYADFISEFTELLGEHYRWAELWNEPNNLSDWDWTLDPQWRIFAEMVGGAAYWLKQLDKRTVLAGMSPTDPNWLRHMFDAGVMEYIDAVGIHGFPGTWEHSWEGWEANVAKARRVLEEHGKDAQVWITEAGFSTWRPDEHGQLYELAQALQAPVERLYWYSLHDLDPKYPSVDGFHSDERDYHFGIKRANGSPKLLYRIWSAEGLEGVRALAGTDRRLRPRRAREEPILILGGAGFIGANLASSFLEEGESVHLFDNLSRPGVERNLRWLQDHHGDRAQISIADVRDRYALRQAVRGVKQVFHLAAQVAVTTSLTDPVEDFEVNARGTLGLLEELRALESPPPLLFTSTNKVYGTLEDLALVRKPSRYEPVDLLTRSYGVGEDRPLDFHSPYGCSKGAADQYVLDYARSYGLRAAVLRMSCIYGPHQLGTEDQGWVAHFLIRSLQGGRLTLYGDGRQVRDVLFVEDLIRAFRLVMTGIDGLSGQAFNLGGGPGNTLSLLELLEMIQELTGRGPTHSFADWRRGDQRYYVSDTRALREAAGWAPRVGVREGVERLHNWLLESRGIASPRPAPGAMRLEVS